MHFLRFLLLFSVLLLTGCGVNYTVSVDSLRDAQTSSGRFYALEPKDAAVDKSDLTFREVIRQISPSFRSRGYTIVDSPKTADNLALVSFWMDEPRVQVNTSMVTRSYPVVVGRGKHQRVEYVYVDEPVVESRTLYTANLLIEAYALDKSRQKDRQIWKTHLRCTSGNEDFHTLLFSMVQVLPSVLGTQSGGLSYYNVFLGNNGEIEVTNLSN